MSVYSVALLFSWLVLITYVAAYAEKKACSNDEQCAPRGYGADCFCVKPYSFVGYCECVQAGNRFDCNEYTDCRQKMPWAAKDEVCYCYIFDPTRAGQCKCEPRHMIGYRNY